MRIAALGLLGFVLVLAGCAAGGGSSPEGDAPDPAVAEAERAATLATVSTEVEALFQTYAETIRTRNWRGTLGLYTDDPRFYWVEAGQKTYPSRQALGDEMARVHLQIAAVEYSTENLRITPLSADHAMLSVDFEQRVEVTDGRQIDLEGSMTAVVERMEEGWKFVAGHSTTFDRSRR